MNRPLLVGGFKILLVAGVYFIAGKFGLQLAFVNASTTAVWPPTGIALAAWLLWGHPVGLGVFAGAFLVNLTTSGLIPSSLGIAVGNTLEAFVGAYLVNRLARGTQAFERPRDVFKFLVLAGLLGTAVSATCGVTTLVLSGLADPTYYGAIWITWWLGDASGALLVTPLLVLWAQPVGWRWGQERIIEAGGLMFCAIFLGLAIFGGVSPLGSKDYPLEFLLLLPVIWAAFRFDSREAVTVTFILSGLALWGTWRGNGPFAVRPPNEALLLLQTFMAVLALTGLGLAAVIADLRQTRADLEQRVTERTATLSEMVASLEHEATERRQIEVALRQSEEQFARVFSASPVAISLSLMNDGRFTEVNNSFLRLFGYQQEEVIGRTSQELNIQTDPEELTRAIQAMRQQGAIHDLEVKAYRKSGEVRHILASVEVIELHGQRCLLAMYYDITERKQAESAYKEIEATLRQLASIVNSSNDAIISKTLEGLVVTWNKGAERLYGYTEAEVKGRSITLLAPPNQPDEIPWLIDRIRRDESVQHHETVRMRKDGTLVEVALTLSPIKDATEAIVGVAVIAHDITEHKRAERALKQANEQLEHSLTQLEQRGHELTLLALLNEMSDFLQSCLTPTEAATVITRFAQQMFPAESGALYLFNPSKNLVEAMLTWGAFSTQLDEQVFTPDECWALRRGKRHIVQDKRGDLFCQHVIRNNLELPTSYVCVPLIAQGEALGVLHLHKTPPASGALSDSLLALAVSVAEHAALALANLKLRETLHNQSIRDPLTRLFNRRYMEESLEREMQRALRQRKPLSVIMLDIDHFKRYNDVYGHAAGDAVLQALGQMLSMQIRAEDIACRYGGEEFTLILPESSLEVAHQRAEHIREKAQVLPVQHQGRKLETITLSLGVATFPEHGHALQQLLQIADAALYRAKQTGRNRVVLAETPSAS